jgi:hypothetical protein
MIAGVLSGIRFVHQQKINGWKKLEDNEVLLLQDELIQLWPSGNETCPPKVDLSASPWPRIAAEIEKLELLVVNVGLLGAEHLMRIAAHNGITPDRVSMLFIDGHTGRQGEDIRPPGFEAVQVRKSEYGAEKTLLNLYYHLLEHGSLPD